MNEEIKKTPNQRLSNIETSADRIGEPELRRFLEEMPSVRAYFIAALQLGMNRQDLANNLAEQIGRATHTARSLEAHSINNLCRRWGIMGGHPSRIRSQEKRAAISERFRELRKDIPLDTYLDEYRRVFDFLKLHDARKLIERDRKMRAVAHVCWRDTRLPPSERIYKYFRIANWYLGTNANPAYVASAFLHKSRERSESNEKNKGEYEQMLSRYIENLVMSPNGDEDGDLTADDISDGQVLVDLTNDADLMQLHAKSEGWRAHERTRLLLANLIERCGGFEQAVGISVQAALYLYGVSVTQNALREFYKTSTPMVTVSGDYVDGMSDDERHVREQKMIRLLRAETKLLRERGEFMHENERDALLTLAVMHHASRIPKRHRHIQKYREALWLNAVTHRTRMTEVTGYSAQFYDLVQAIDSATGGMVVWKNFTISLVEGGEGKRAVQFRYGLDFREQNQEIDFLQRRLLPELKAIGEGVPTELFGALLQRFGSTFSSCDVRPMHSGPVESGTYFPTLNIAISSTYPKK